MTPAAALGALRSQLAEHGEDIVLRRWSGPSSARVASEVALRGFVRGYQAREIVGSIVQGDRLVIIANDPAAIVPAGKVALSTLLPLTRNDKLVIGGREAGIKSISARPLNIGFDITASA